MLQKIKALFFGKPVVEIDHDYFGKIFFMGGSVPEDDDYWECELIVNDDKEPISIQITADINGPTSKQVMLCKANLSNLDGLFAKCWFIFEPDFQQWTDKKFSGKWRDDFELMGFSIPKDADTNNAWNVCYFVDSANHYFTAQFENGIAKYNEIDG